MALTLAPKALSGATLSEAASTAVFALTYLGVALGRLPGFRLDRTAIAFVGGVLMVAFGALGLDQAIAAIDFNTIALLLGMMVLAGSLDRAGFFRLATGAALRHVPGRFFLLVAIVLLSGVLSALLVNDTVCVVLTPLVLEIVLALGCPPVPYLIALATAANIGSAATITGNPQNVIIASASGLGYAHFAGAEIPPAAIGLAMTVVFVAAAWRREIFARGRLVAPPARPARVHPVLVAKDLGLLGFFVIACLAGMRPAAAALIAAALCLLTPGVKSARVLARVDWSLLLMFAGLFVTVAGIERTLLTPSLAARIAAFDPARTVVLAPLVAVLSNLVSNVPAILLLRPILARAADAPHAWLVAAMAATYAGNFTLLGSVANLIVAERAASRGIRLGFWQYAAIGVPLTVATIGVGMWWLG
jgi:Na+/H+ antiporter NhaD/arsenite permease-like protein